MPGPPIKPFDFGQFLPGPLDKALDVVFPADDPLAGASPTPVVGMASEGMKKVPHAVRLIYRMLTKDVDAAPDPLKKLALEKINSRVPSAPLVQAPDNFSYATDIWQKRDPLLQELAQRQAKFDEVARKPTTFPSEEGIGNKSILGRSRVGIEVGAQERKLRSMAGLTQKKISEIPPDSIEQIQRAAGTNKYTIQDIAKMFDLTEQMTKNIVRMPWKWK